MNPKNKLKGPDNTAVRTALWRALHAQIDAKPHIIEDDIGIRMIEPQYGWKERPDMKYTKRLRAAIVARSRFIDDFIIGQTNKGINQIVILGAGLDTFAQRKQDIASKTHIYEIDKPDTLEWKRQRLIDIGFSIQEYLNFVPVNFETDSWMDQLIKAGFNDKQPAIIASAGVSLYLTIDALQFTLNRVAGLAPGTRLAMAFYLPIDLLDEEDKSMQEIAEKGAREAGTPMISFFTPEEINALAKNAGFKDIKTITTKDMIQLYFKDRTDNLKPASGEIFLLATV